ncbi:MAG: hypothetical protein WC496_01965 [Phycisphaerae bacterium]|jgi:hypothetical protein
MPITLHCESCKKKIVAPDNAGGKWGKCPFCNHRCYIPLPPDENEEELTLSPVDETEEVRYRRMMQETYNITESLLHETEEPSDAETFKNMNEKEFTAQIIKYLRLMADGSLDEAHNLAERIVPYKSQAKAIFEKLLKAKKPEPELQDVPKKVLDGFIKNMLTRIG